MRQVSQAFFEDDSVNSSHPASTKSGFVFVFVTITLDMLALGLIVPVLPNLLKQMTGGDVGEAAHMIGIFGLFWAFMQFVSMPIMGGLSDQIGRKPILLISNFGQAAANLITAFAPSFWALLLARTLSGAVSAVGSTANAYVADTEPPESRAQKFGMLGAAFGLGFILGPAIGGFLGKINLHLPFFVAAGLCTFNGFFGLILLKESLKPEHRRPFDLVRANPIGSIHFLWTNPRILTLAIIRGLCDFAQVVYPTTFVLYGFYRYGWGPDVAGLTLGLVGLSSAIVQGGLVGPIIRKLGEVSTLVLGLILGALGYGLYAWAPNQYVLWMCVPIASLAGIYGAAIQSLLTRQIGPDEQGRLQGAIGAVQAGTSMVGPIVFTAIFAWSIAADRATTLPGLALGLSCICLIIATLIALTSARQFRADQALAQS
ncbi:tetracycline resistance protein, class C [Candidatus Phycosocius bacilliformis]|uniref:Tetracycline resistance protein, class C n=1 Tax=Candidatus Phycosocius bacilliformis TaxID=1445552 RepID=A0A2P2EB89_9PROT|nr:TCR/Tet family MFS transporter [Candidatus Phycosocius bacilliformis]GBF58336.1 tetracycline resistance protein, class C [Candidatus Phycosocius bacilliformis]